MNISATSIRRVAVSSSLVVLAMTAWCVATASGLAESTMHVQLADLDLASPGGRQIAKDRLHQAAVTVCSGVSDQLDLARRDHVIACIDRLMPKASLALAQLVAQRESIQVAGRAGH